MKIRTMVDLDECVIVCLCLKWLVYHVWTKVGFLYIAYKVDQFVSVQTIEIMENHKVDINAILSNER